MCKKALIKLGRPSHRARVTSTDSPDDATEISSSLSYLEDPEKSLWRGVGTPLQNDGRSDLHPGPPP